MDHAAIPAAKFDTGKPPLVPYRTIRAVPLRCLDLAPASSSQSRAAPNWKSPRLSPPRMVARSAYRLPDPSLFRRVERRPASPASNL